MLLRRNCTNNFHLQNGSTHEGTTIWKEPPLRRSSLQLHDLYTLQTREVGDIIRDEKTGFSLEIINEIFPFSGNGKGKGKGLKILDQVKRHQVFCWSEEPLIEMDLTKYTRKEYVDNGWIFFGKRACPIHSIPMLANARAGVNIDDVEIGNTFSGTGKLPESLALKYPVGIYAYLRAEKVLKPDTTVLIHKYGNGNACLKWGQDATVKRQQSHIRRYKESESKLLLTKQKGHSICDECGIILPRNKKKKIKSPHQM